MNLVHTPERLVSTLRAIRRRLFYRSELLSDPGMRLHVTGPDWFIDLFRTTIDPESTPEAILAGPNTDVPGSVEEGPMVGFRNPNVELAVSPDPFVDLYQSNPLVQIVPDGLPPDFTEVARHACGPTGTALSASGTMDFPGLVEERARTHRRFREAHTRTSRDVAKEALGIINSTGIPEEKITVVCVSNRPHRLTNILANYDRQEFADRKLMLVLNSDAYDRADVEREISDVPNATWFRVAESESLGTCLNAAIDRIDTRYMAKFDDDDWYGSHYLGDMVLTHRFARAALVGKHTHYAYREGSDETILRFPGHEFQYGHYLAGGTLVLDLNRMNGVRFPDRTLGEDARFLDMVSRAGLPICASDAFNYLQHRDAENTWQVAEKHYTRGAVTVANRRAIDLVEA